MGPTNYLRPMRWWLCFLCSWQMVAQSTLAVDLPEGTYQIHWNEWFLGSATTGFRLLELTADTVQLEIQSATDDKVHLKRMLYINGVDNYHYAMVAVGEQGHMRLRYRGHLGLPTHPVLEFNALADLDTLNLALPVPLHEENLAVGDSARVELVDSAYALTPSVVMEPEGKVDSAITKSLESTFNGICDLETEFERLRQSRELALLQPLGETDFRKLLSCMQFDNSRLLFLHDVRMEYQAESWFKELGDTFDFNLSKQQFIKMLESPSP